MVKVRNCRNKLAHGELSFQECCRDFSIQYVEVSKNNTLVYLEQLIDKVDNYIQAKSYRRPVSSSWGGNYLSRFFSGVYNNLSVLLGKIQAKRMI